MQGGGSLIPHHISLCSEALFSQLLPKTAKYICCYLQILESATKMKSFSYPSSTRGVLPLPFQVKKYSGQRPPDPTLLIKAFWNTDSVLRVNAVNQLSLLCWASITTLWLGVPVIDCREGSEAPGPVQGQDTLLERAEVGQDLLCQAGTWRRVSCLPTQHGSHEATMEETVRGRLGIHKPNPSLSPLFSWFFLLKMLKVEIGRCFCFFFPLFKSFAQREKGKKGQNQETCLSGHSGPNLYSFWQPHSNPSQSVDAYTSWLPAAAPTHQGVILAPDCTTYCFSLLWLLTELCYTADTEAAEENHWADSCQDSTSGKGIYRCLPCAPPEHLQKKFTSCFSQPALQFCPYGGIP